MPLTRRELLTRSALTPIALAPLAILSSCAKESTTLCADPESLTRGEAHMRKTLEYIAVSTDTAQTCNNCQFFRRGPHGENSQCGDCEILSGSVDNTGYCTSWALKS